MINVSSISNAIYTLISSNATVVSSGVSVDLNEFMSTDPNRTPYVNINYDGMVISPHTVGIRNPWEATVRYKIIAQDESMESAQKANENLENLTKVILDAVNTSKDLSGTVNCLVGFEVTPLNRDITEDEDWLFNNEITLLAEVIG